VLGKSQHEDEEVQLPKQVHRPLERLEQALEPPTPEWPVFVTSHAPSLYGNLPDDVDPSAGDPLELHRKHGVVPPSLSTNGGRSVLKRLCDEADLEIDGEYLKPHGARRGVGEAIYREHGAAQHSGCYATPIHGQPHRCTPISRPKNWRKRHLKSLRTSDLTATFCST